MVATKCINSQDSIKPMGEVISEMTGDTAA